MNILPYKIFMVQILERANSSSRLLHTHTSHAATSSKKRRSSQLTGTHAYSNNGGKGGGRGRKCWMEANRGNWCFRMTTQKSIRFKYFTWLGCLNETWYAQQKIFFKKTLLFKNPEKEWSSIELSRFQKYRIQPVKCASTPKYVSFYFCLE